MRVEVEQNEWMDDESQRLERERELVSSNLFHGSGGSGRDITLPSTALL